MSHKPHKAEIWLTRLATGCSGMDLGSLGFVLLGGRGRKSLSSGRVGV